MKSEALKLARLNRDAELMREFIRLLEHPLYSVLLCFVVIETLQSIEIGKPGEKRQMMGSVVGSALETAMIAGPVLVSLANSPAVQALATKGMSSVTSSLLPALVAK